MESSETRSVSLTLTQNCNLACSYCYEHNKSPKKMTFSLAKQIIDFEIDHKADWVNEFQFDLFGGEPFLEFDLIKQITEYLCSRNIPVPYTIFTTTNGTLVHGAIQDWLRDHSDCIICGLSLDGTREMHNLNRSNSYDDIDIDFFRKQYPGQSVKMTISKETLPYLADGVMELHQIGFPVSCNLAYEIDWSSSENTFLLQRELEKLIAFYLDNPDIEPCSMLETGIVNIGNHSNQAVRFCGSGIYMVSYDVDGRSYPCQFFMPLSVGEEKARLVKNIQFPHDIIPPELLDQKCKSCIARSACPNCFGANYASTGSIYSRDDNMCRLIKIILKAQAYFCSKRWELGQLKETGDELQALLHSVVRIQEELEI